MRPHLATATAIVGGRRSANGAGCCPRRCSANAPACCPRSTCSDRPQPLQCECTCLLPLLDLLRQTGLDLLGQTAAAAAVRLLRQTVAPQPRQPPQCEWSAAVRTRPHLSQQAFRRHEQHEHEPPTIAGAVVGACTHGYTGSCSCVSRTSVARAASARTASCCCMSSTSLARGHIPRRWTSSLTTSWYAK